jgi:hypothetical protein
MRDIRKTELKERPVEPQLFCVEFRNVTEDQHTECADIIAAPQSDYLYDMVHIGIAAQIRYALTRARLPILWRRNSS